MIDISDGLSSEVMHLCKSSKVGCAIYEDKIPIDYTAISTAEEFGLSPATCALNGGEDYELLFTIAQSDYDKIKNDADLTIIGYIANESDGCNLITRNEESLPLSAQGWNPL